MANDVTITVRSVDRTGAGMASAKHSVDDLGKAVKSTSGQARDARGRFTALGDAVKKTGQDVDGLGKQTESWHRRSANAIAGVVSSFGNIGDSIVKAGGPYAAVAALGAVIATLPVIATAAGAAIGIGLGGAIAGIGILVAAQNAKVKASFSGLKDHVVSNLKAMASPFEDVLIRLAGRAATAFDELAPHLRHAFDSVAPSVEQLGSAIIDSLGDLGPFVDRVANAFNPLIGVLSNRLPGMIDNLTNQLARMAEAVDPRAFDRLLTGVNAFVTGSANIVVALNRIGQAYDALQGKTSASIAVQNAQRDVWRKLGVDVGDANDQWAVAYGTFGKMSGALGQVGDSAQESANKLRDWHNAVLASYNSELAFDQAVSAANDDIKKQHGHLTRFDQLGKNNRQLLLQLAGAAKQYAEDVKAAGGDSQGAMNKGYNAFVKAARGAGLSKKAADAFARSIGLIPTSHRTTYKDNAGSAISRAKAVQRAINSIRGHTVHIGVQYDVISAPGVYRQGGRVPDRLGGVSRLGGISRMQTGGLGRGPTLMGEEGPELTDLPPGAYVRPEATTRGRMMQQQGAGMAGPIVINVQLDGKTLASLLFDPLKGVVRQKGGKGPGSAQKAWGYA
jgi:hypothetical protein